VVSDQFGPQTGWNARHFSSVFLIERWSASRSLGWSEDGCLRQCVTQLLLVGMPTSSEFVPQKGRNARHFSSVFLNERSFTARFSLGLVHCGTPAHLRVISHLGTS
jgi:hypothetical protein